MVAVLLVEVDVDVEVVVVVVVVVLVVVLVLAVVVKLVEDPVVDGLYKSGNVPANGLLTALSPPERFLHIMIP